MVIYFTSDLHFGHNKEFIYKARGYNTILEHDIKVLDNILSAGIKEDDDLYILGDLMLGDTDWGIELIRRLPGRIHIMTGNHDTENKIDQYMELPNVVEIVAASIIKYGKYHFYLSHYPTLTGNTDGHISNTLLNLFGHTHQKEKFYNNNWNMYNVSLDAHDNRPVSIEEVIEDIKKKKSSC